MIFAEKAWNLLRSYQNIINWKKLTFALQKYSLLSADSSKFSNSYSNFVNLAKIPTKWSILMVFEESTENRKYFCKTNVNFFLHMIFWQDLSKFQAFSAKIICSPPIFSEFWIFKLSHLKGFHMQDLSQIYMMYLCPKIFAPPFWPSWEGCNMVKMLDFLWCSAKQFSALGRGREKPKHVLESPDISGHVVYKNWELTLKAETKIKKINFWAKSQERL